MRAKQKSVVADLLNVINLCSVDFVVCCFVHDLVGGAMQNLPLSYFNFKTHKISINTLCSQKKMLIRRVKFICDKCYESISFMREGVFFRPL